ncbi:MAG: DUF305 domain-containing protein [Zhongshania sp.]|uniref:DUF305 domain-containing protein n=1 Tax=Zhongshania sp. TaxID=1971902 RepID=UPI0026030E49|nr:DUF305 domain-containing protein [Zhongshania sp.]MDF1693475.1 DUF305 domain-containing protein [Zhongshania sp.]
MAIRTLSYIFAAVLALVVGSAAGHQYRDLQDARANLRSLAPSAVDIGFSQAMYLHHRQAIAMAQLLLDGRPTGLTAQARAIAATQLVELGEMQGWLRLWNQPVTPSNSNMSWMLLGTQAPNPSLNQYLLDCGRSPNGMLGMASLEELNALRNSEGLARDTLFLHLMLSHHQGGLPMAEFAAEQASLPAVRALAARITLDQATEIQQFKIMLAAITPQNTPAN